MKNDKYPYLVPVPVFYFLLVMTDDLKKSIKNQTDGLGWAVGKTTGHRFYW